jgi:hypothetical protein
LDKVGLPDQHHQIDGVKIFFTGKTSGKIGLWVYGGVKPVTQGTQETKAAFCHPTRDTQCFFDEHLNVDLISKGVKLAVGKAPIGHIRLPDRAWVLS